ncbi:MAG: hypothetical protein RLP09_16265 [Sandaracinaceae bacterium]
MSNFDLAFVLLAEAAPPNVEALSSAIRAIGFPDARVLPPRAEDDGSTEVQLGGDQRLLVMLMPAPHPDAAGMAGPLTPPAEELAAAPAHYVVTALGLEGQVADKDRALAALTAAVIRSSEATAAMLGHGRLFYDAGIFVEVAEAAFEQSEAPVEVIVDVTAAREPDGRLSLLSHGLERYDRENFFVTVSAGGVDAVDFVLSLARWMIERPDVHLPTGDTVGRDAKEQIVVQRGPHPLDPARTVVRLDLPG